MDLPSLKPREVEAAISKDGWFVLRKTKGGHRQYKHPTKPGRVTISFTSGDIAIGTLNSIIRQSGLTREQFIALL